MNLSKLFFYLLSTLFFISQHSLAMIPQQSNSPGHSSGDQSKPSDDENSFVMVPFQQQSLIPYQDQEFNYSSNTLYLIVVGDSWRVADSQLASDKKQQAGNLLKIIGNAATYVQSHVPSIPYVYGSEAPSSPTYKNQEDAFTLLAANLAQNRRLQSSQVIYTTSDTIKLIQTLRQNLGNRNIDSSVAGGAIEIVTYSYGYDSEIVNAIITKLPPFSINMAIQINPTINATMEAVLDKTRIQKIYNIYSKAELPKITPVIQNALQSSLDYVKNFTPSKTTISVAVTGAVAGFATTAAVGLGGFGAVMGAAGALKVQQGTDTLCKYGAQVTENVVEKARQLFAKVTYLLVKNINFNFIFPVEKDLLLRKCSGRKYKQLAYLNESELTLPIKNIRLLAFKDNKNSSAIDLNLNQLRSPETISTLSALLLQTDAYFLNFDLIAIYPPEDRTSSICLINRPVIFNPQQKNYVMDDGNGEYELFGIHADHSPHLHPKELSLSRMLMKERINDYDQWKSQLLKDFSKFISQGLVQPSLEKIRLAAGRFVHQKRTPSEIKDECFQLVWRPVNRFNLTSLHIGALTGELNFTKLNTMLSSEGSQGLKDTNIPDTRGNTPLHYIALFYKANVDYFIERNQIGDSTLPNNLLDEGQKLAASMNDKQMSKIKNDNKKTPLNIIDSATEQLDSIFKKQQTSKLSADDQLSAIEDNSSLESGLDEELLSKTTQKQGRTWWPFRRK